jgi:hypothetical protein
VGGAKCLDGGGRWRSVSWLDRGRVRCRCRWQAYHHMRMFGTQSYLEEVPDTLPLQRSRC